MKFSNFDTSLLFTSQLTEADLTQLSHDGHIPEWISGNFISTGPAQFEIGSKKFKHWFDGFAMLKKFEFRHGQVSFQNKFLKSQQYVKSQDSSRLYHNEFATRAGIISPFLQSNHYDNCNVNIAKIGNTYVAMTESPYCIEFDSSNLNTLGSFDWDDKLRGHISTAHPHYDPIKHEAINVLIELGPKNKYHLYRVADNSKKRELTVSYVSNELFYIHSFSITPR